MLTSKQRAVLRSIASTAETIGQIGKEGINPTIANEVALALKKREIVKYRVLETSPVTAREAADKLSELTQSEVVQVIGSKFVLYRRNEKKPVIEL